MKVVKIKLSEIRSMVNKAINEEVAQKKKTKRLKESSHEPVMEGGGEAETKLRSWMGNTEKEMNMAADALTEYFQVMSDPESSIQKVHEITIKYNPERKEIKFMASVESESGESSTIDLDDFLN